MTMAELASIKVVLLDIGKEQRKKEKKSDEAPSSCRFPRPRRSGSQETCIHLPTPETCTSLPFSSLLRAHDLQDAVSHLPATVPTKTPSPVRCVPKSRCSGALARTNELIASLTEGTVCPISFVKAVLVGTLIFPFSSPVNPVFLLHLHARDLPPRDQAYGMSPSISVPALTLEQVSLFGLLMGGY